MKIGFTGSRKGMTHAQRDRIAHFANTFGDFTLLHGGCIGADAEVHEWLRRCFRGLEVEIYPSTLVKKQADFIGPNILVHEEAEPLKRNKAIVDACDMLIAAPASFHEIPRSGTWSTIRYATKMRKPTYVIAPDGSLMKHEAFGSRITGRKGWTISNGITAEHKDAHRFLNREGGLLQSVKVNGEPTVAVCRVLERPKRDGSEHEFRVEPLVIFPTESMEITTTEGKPLTLPSAEEYLDQ